LIPVLALLLVGLNLRPVLAVVSLLTDSIRASNGMSFEQIGWLTSLPMMAMGLIAMAGGLVYRMGYRRGVAIGLALTAASALAKLASHEPLWLMGSSVAAGLGIGIAQSLIPGYIKTRFPHRVDLLMGLYVSMIMGGAALAAASASALLHWLDWQGTMAFWAGLAIAGIALEHGLEALWPLLARSDIVINLLPLTAQTADLLDRRFFAAMRRGAALVNLARGGHLVEADLLQALDSGQLDRAVLDVFRQEPLVTDHPFWCHPRVTVLPHSAAATDMRSAASIVAQNLQALRDGRPISHLVQRKRGY